MGDDALTSADGTLFDLSLRTVNPAGGRGG